MTSLNLPLVMPQAVLYGPGMLSMQLERPKPPPKAPAKPPPVAAPAEAAEAAEAAASPAPAAAAPAPAVISSTGGSALIPTTVGAPPAASAPAPPPPSPPSSALEGSVELQVMDDSVGPASALESKLESKLELDHAATVELEAAGGSGGGLLAEGLAETSVNSPHGTTPVSGRRSLGEEPQL